MNERASYSEISAQIKARYDRSTEMLWLHGNLRETACGFDRRPKLVLSIVGAPAKGVELDRAFVARQCRVTFVTDQPVFHTSLIATSMRTDQRWRQADDNSTYLDSVHLRRVRRISRRHFGGLKIRNARI
jgi:hypothetical protein